MKLKVNILLDNTPVNLPKSHDSYYFIFNNTAKNMFYLVKCSTISPSFTAPAKSCVLLCKMTFLPSSQPNAHKLNARTDRTDRTESALSRLIYRVNIDAILLFIQITFHLTYHFQFYHFHASCARPRACARKAMCTHVAISYHMFTYVYIVYAYLNAYAI